MKFFSLLFAFFLSLSAHAATGPKILECNISFGPDQAVTVRSTPKGFVLEELTDSGSMLSRPLKAREIQTGRIKLRADSPFDSGLLSRRNGVWMYDFGDAIGNADCTIDRLASIRQ